MPAIPPAVRARRLENALIGAAPKYSDVINNTPVEVSFSDRPPDQPLLKHEEKVSVPVDVRSAVAEKPAAVNQPRSDESEVASAKPSEFRAARAKSSSETEAVPAAAVTRPGDSATRAYEFYRTGRASFDSGDVKTAIDSYLQSLNLEPNSAEVNLSLAYAYLTDKKPQEAVKRFKLAIEFNPDLAEAHYGIGFTYFGMKKMREASNAFKKAAALAPEMSKAHYGLALTYQELGNESGLVEEYRVLQRLDSRLAKKLADSFQDSSLPCRSNPFCK
jgi:tetratricopeptide (TPR) repeat protein